MFSQENPMQHSSTQSCIVRNKKEAILKTLDGNCMIDILS